MIYKPEQKWTWIEVAMILVVFVAFFLFLLPTGIVWAVAFGSFAALLTFLTFYFEQY